MFHRSPPPPSPLLAPSPSFSSDALGLASVHEKLHFLVDFGVLAAGGEPWVLSIGERALDLHVAHRCPAPIGDAGHRAAIVACGLGLGVLRLGLRSLACVESTILAPDDARPSLLARVFVERHDGVEDGAYVLQRALGAELVTRPNVSRSFVDELTAHAEAERARLSIDLADAPPAPDPPPPCDAITYHDLTSSMPWLLHDGSGPRFTSALVGTQSARADGVLDWLATGQALARIALRARADGLITAVEPPRRSGDEDGCPVVSIRIGVVEPPGRSSAPQASRGVG